MFDEYREPGTVVIALNRTDDPDHDPFFRIQMNMAAAMLDSGPVIIAVDDRKARDRISAACDDFTSVCEGIRRGTVRVLQVEHDGPWVRDYGPQIGIGRDGTPIVLDADYNDVRGKKQLWRERTETDRERLGLIKRREALDSYTHDDDDDEAGSSEIAERRKHIDDRLAILSQLKDIYSDDGIVSRDEDDASPFFLAQAAFRNPAFHVVATGITIDGGNLMRLGPATCATTSDVMAANKANVDLGQVLRTTYGCSTTVYLSPLPGPVIKHIDMFLLPVDAHRVLLASYEPKENVLSRHWRDADGGLRNLTMEAALAMDRNAKILSDYGFEVVRVPAPLPRADPQFGTYYPTNLNALVRVDLQRKAHVLVPTYEDYEEDVQAVATQAIRTALPGADVRTAEATAAGQRQGAVHCLSLVLPLDTTVFADPENVSKWGDWSAIETGMTAKERAASSKLLGTWRVTSNKSVRFEFKEAGLLEFTTDDGLSLHRYSMRNSGLLLEVSDPDADDVETFTLEWSGTNRLFLAPRGGGKRFEIERIGGRMSK
jgi:agmatine/peptidylarginine deiminase